MARRATEAGKRPPRPAVTRLSLYLRHLEHLHAAGTRTVSSGELGRACGTTAAQVRKDFAYFGQFGRRGLGYDVATLSRALRRILGTQKVRGAALVGVGNLGSALLAYGGFAERGFQIALAFDRDRRKVGRKVGGVEVLPESAFAQRIAATGTVLGIVAVGASAAQEVADMMVAAGIRGILNFAPIELAVPADVAVYSVDLAVALEQISYRLKTST